MSVRTSEARELRAVTSVNHTAERLAKIEKSIVQDYVQYIVTVFVFFFFLGFSPKTSQRAGGNMIVF